MCAPAHLPSLPVIIMTQCMFERHDKHQPLALWLPLRSFASHVKVEPF